jgi:hypothetical protein
MRRCSNSVVIETCQPRSILRNQWPFMISPKAGIICDPAYALAEMLSRSLDHARFRPNPTLPIWSE